jgi:hypothetical protein
MTTPRLELALCAIALPRQPTLSAQWVTRVATRRALRLASSVTNGAPILRDPGARRLRHSVFPRLYAPR